MLFSSAALTNSITSQKRSVSVCLCVNQGGVKMALTPTHQAYSYMGYAVSSAWISANRHLTIFVMKRINDPAAQCHLIYCLIILLITVYSDLGYLCHYSWVECKWQWEWQKETCQFQVLKQTMQTSGARAQQEFLSRCEFTMFRII